MLRGSARHVFLAIVYIAEDVRAVAWQQRNKSSMTSDKKTVGNACWF